MQRLIESLSLDAAPVLYQTDTVVVLSDVAKDRTVATKYRKATSQPDLDTQIRHVKVQMALVCPI